jgi:hypothetical protein
MPVLEEAMLKQPYVSRICNVLGLSGSVTQMDDAVEIIAGACGQNKSENVEA